MSTIKPKEIHAILEKTTKIREIGGKFVPCFAGDSGIGKSEICQAYAKAQGEDYKFIDLRLAYLEGPDMVGMPQSVMLKIDGKEVWTTIHALPDFLPKSGRGLLLFEEPNRAHESVMQTMMQILTDRKIHNYSLPEGWIIAAAINPEGKYNVNSMDAAVKNRFAIFEAKFDHNSFVDYAKSAKFDDRLIAFLDSGLWTYKSIDEIGDDGFYVSSRSFSNLNSVMKVCQPSEPEFAAMAQAVLGKVVGADFIKYVNEIRPILFEDFVKNEADAFKRLKLVTSNKAQYVGDLVSATVNSLSDAFKEKKCEKELVLKVALVIDADQANNLVYNAFTDVSEEEFDKVFNPKDKLWKEFKKRREGQKVA